VPATAIDIGPPFDDARHCPGSLLQIDANAAQRVSKQSRGTFMIWRGGFVYAHSPLPKNLDGRKFDLVFLFAHSPFSSWTSVSSAQQ
jgi:hypothetical protein